MTYNKNSNEMAQVSFEQIALITFNAVKEKHPMLRSFCIKKKKTVYQIRAKYGDRRLYACNDTIEEAVMHFMEEINKKVFRDEYIKHILN